MNASHLRTLLRLNCHRLDTRPTVARRERWDSYSRAIPREHIDDWWLGFVVLDSQDWWNSKGAPSDCARDVYQRSLGHNGTICFVGPQAREFYVIPIEDFRKAMRADQACRGLLSPDPTVDGTQAGIDFATPAQ